MPPQTQHRYYVFSSLFGHMVPPSTKMYGVDITEDIIITPAVHATTGRWPPEPCCHGSWG